jgi:predicted transcriptional regulator
MIANRTTLLSVRPRFAEAILNGTKTVEIRRRRADLAEGSLCLLYASSPARALVGAIRVRQVDTDSRDALWNKWGDASGLTRHDFDAYLSGSTLPCAIVVDAAVRLPRAIALPELRSRQTNFVTPQSYRFLRAEEFASLTCGHAQHLGRLVIAGA